MQIETGLGTGNHCHSGHVSQLCLGHSRFSLADPGSRLWHGWTKRLPDDRLRRFWMNRAIGVGDDASAIVWRAHQQRMAVRASSAKSRQTRFTTLQS